MSLTKSSNDEGEEEDDDDDDFGDTISLLEGKTIQGAQGGQKGKTGGMWKFCIQLIYL